MHARLLGIDIGMVILVEMVVSKYWGSLKWGFHIDLHFQSPGPSLVGGCAAALKRQPQWPQLGKLPPRSGALQRSWYRHNSRLYRGRRLCTISNCAGRSQRLVAYLGR